MAEKPTLRERQAVSDTLKKLRELRMKLEREITKKKYGV